MKNGAALLASVVDEVDGSSWRVSQIYVSRDGRRGDPVWHARVTFWGAQIQTRLTLDENAPDSVRRAVRRAGYGPRYPMRSVKDLRGLEREIRLVDRVIDGADVATTFGKRSLVPTRAREEPVPAARIARVIAGWGRRWWVRGFTISRSEQRGDLRTHAWHIVVDDADCWLHDFHVQLVASPKRSLAHEATAVGRSLGRGYRRETVPSDDWALWTDRLSLTRAAARHERSRLDRELFAS